MNKSWDYCGFDEKFRKYYQQIVKSEKTGCREHWYGEKLRREFTDYCLVLIYKNQKTLIYFLMSTVKTEISLVIIIIIIIIWLLF